MFRGTVGPLGREAHHNQEKQMGWAFSFPGLRPSLDERLARWADIGRLFQCSFGGQDVVRSAGGWGERGEGEGAPERGF
jgi:hypothetical protein